MYCRLGIASGLLNEALSCNGKNRRRCVLLAVWHLIAWIAGDTSIPRPNAVSCNDDDMKYCDLCFKPKKGKNLLVRVDHLDLCGACSEEYSKEQRAEEYKVKLYERERQVDEIAGKVKDKLVELKLYKR